MTELEKYRMIGTVEECRIAMSHYNQNNKPRHAADENCKTCKNHNKCNMEKYSSWCIYYKRKIEI